MRVLNHKPVKNPFSKSEAYFIEASKNATKSKVRDFLKNISPSLSSKNMIENLSFRCGLWIFELTPFLT